MDPQACLERLLQAIEDGDHAEAVQTGSNLLHWLLKGGTRPKTSALQLNAIVFGLADAADALEDEA